MTDEHLSGSRADEAVATLAERVYAQLPEKERQATRRLFLNLVVLGEGREDACAPAVVPEDRDAQRIADRFCAPETRLLAEGASDEKGRRVVELAHEALLRNWPAFRTWVDENRESLRIRDRLRARSRRYQEGGEDPSLLLRPGRALEEGRQLLSEHGDVDVEPPLQTFVERSITTDEARARARERAFSRRNRAYAAAAVGAIVLAALAVWQAWAAAGRAADARARIAVAQQQCTSAECERDAVLRLADAKKARDLVEEADTLWPVHPDQAAAMRRWRASAEALLEGRSGHEATLDTLGVGSLPYSAFPDEASAWKHMVLTGLLADLDRVRDPKDPSAGLLARVAARYEAASTLRERSVDDHAAAWAETVAGITASPLYGGLEIVVQVGLVPLGPDPVTGLYEFAHLGSGSLPSRDPETNQPVYAEDTAIVFVLLPGSTFHLGAQGREREGPNYDPDAKRNESDHHGRPVEVTLSPFFLAEGECTQAQWKALTGGETPSNYGPDTTFGRKAVTLRNPVEQVSWEDCDRWLRRHRLRLPTEAQWEYACRAGTETPWFTGREPRTLSGYANIADVYYHDKGGFESFAYTKEVRDGFVIHAPVGSFRANAFGLYDMHGNVGEWCQDRYDAGFYASLARGTRSDRRDPRGPGGQDPGARVNRGGAWGFDAQDARSARRSRLEPGSGLWFIGVRPARSLTSD